MKSKKGFTLVELLAVIAILAILMLLIMPNILNMFNQGKKDSFKVQVESIIKAAEKQKQVDAFNSSETNIYCSGINAACQGNLKLDVTETGAKYVVMFENNKVVGVALEDSNYCYINMSDVTNINPDDFIENSNLVCSDTNCECKGATRSVYWTVNEGGASTNYEANSKPSNTKNSYTSLGLSQPGIFVKTSINSTDEVTGHEACMYYNNKTFCLAKGYWDTNETKTLEKLKAAMEEALGKTTNNCTSASSYATCYMTSNARCASFKTGSVYCRIGSNGCTVEANGNTSCY